MKRISLLLVTLLIFSVCTSFAFSAKDVPGSKDYPLVSRFKGSVIQWYQKKNFDKYYLLELKDKQLMPRVVEGRITRIQYTAGREHSIFEIVKSYEAALKDAGFTVFLTLNENNAPSNLNEKLYIGEFNGINKLPSGSVKPDHNGKWSYFEAKGEANGRDVYIVAYITNLGQPLITFDAVEVAKMQAGLVTAQKIDKGIAASGRVVLDGVFFDTGKATIKHESGPALKNIAAYLSENPSKKFFIVGHTDNVGSFKGNISLSEARAKAVAEKLVKDYHVSRKQLATHGVANLCPVTSNSEDAGRARNRRVEIVEQ